MTNCDIHKLVFRTGWAHHVGKKGFWGGEEAEEKERKRKK